MYQLNNDLIFPDVSTANRHGIVAVGGDLTTNRLIIAYKNGIFPWFNEDEPIIWWAPAKRMVFFLDEIKIPKTLQKIINSNVFKVTFNQNFDEVILKCKNSIRKGEVGTWISNDMIAAYSQLHKLGYAKSVEVWQGDKLVGGLYGIDLGHIFCGESMFSEVSNASKIAFFALAQELQSNKYTLLDCQVYNDHLSNLGCLEIERTVFMQILNKD